MNGLGKQKITTNPVTDKLRNGEPAVGAWLSLCSPVSAEIMTRIDWDWLVVDVQHSPVDFNTMVNCFRAIQLGGVVPMARVPWNDTVWTQRALDAGAMGLVVPMINTADEARTVVSNMKYQNKGQRSFGGSRISPYIDGDYGAWTDENLAIIVMIETVQAVENAGEIMAVDGVSGCFIGPSDLALSMEVTDKGPGSELESAMLRVLEASLKAGKAAGKHCLNGKEVGMRIKQGFQFLALSSDANFLAKAAEAEFDDINSENSSGDSAMASEGSPYQ